MSQTKEQKNKARVLEAFDTLFNRRDFRAAETYWSPDYIQHSAHIPQGRDGLFDLVRQLPSSARYESGLIMAEGDLLMMHGRFSGRGSSPNWIALDIVRMVDGVLVEHWDVIEDEVSRADSKSGLPMFGASFPEEDLAAVARVDRRESLNIQYGRHAKMPNVRDKRGSRSRP